MISQYRSPAMRPYDSVGQTAPMMSRRHHQHSHLTYYKKVPRNTPFEPSLVVIGLMV